MEIPLNPAQLRLLIDRHAAAEAMKQRLDDVITAILSSHDLPAPVKAVVEVRQEPPALVVQLAERNGAEADVEAAREEVR